MKIAVSSSGKDLDYPGTPNKKVDAIVKVTETGQGWSLSEKRSE